MEKRKVIGLKGYFTCTLLLFFVGMLVILALAFIVLLLCMNAGIIAPANAGEKEAGAEITRQSEFGIFTNDLEPAFYEYIYFDKEGNVKSSSLEGSALLREVSRYKADNVTYGTGMYVFYEDGSRCLFIWNYAANYTNRELRNILPYAELLMLYFAGAFMVIYFLLFVRGMGRNLGKKLALVETASEQIAGQNLDTPIAASTGIKEFNHTMQSMDDMRITLKDALIKQWESEQQRKQEITALAHDIKTPLTIINGNAELLLEDVLEEEQAVLVKAIYSAGLRAQQYVSALQQVSIIDLDNEEMEQIDVVSMMDELNAVLTPLAKDKSISLEYVHCENLRHITVYPPCWHAHSSTLWKTRYALLKSAGISLFPYVKTNGKRCFAFRTRDRDFHKRQCTMLRKCSGSKIQAGQAAEIMELAFPLPRKRHKSMQDS